MRRISTAAALVAIIAGTGGCFRSEARFGDATSEDGAIEVDTAIDTAVDDPSWDTDAWDTWLDTGMDVGDAETDPYTDPVYDAPPACEAFEFGIVWSVTDGSYHDEERIYAVGSSPIMHMIAVYGPGPGGRIAIHVGTTYRPVILVLSSYESVTWVIDAEPGAVIDRVLLYGYDPQLAEVGAGVPVVNLSETTGMHACSRWPFCPGGSDTQEVVWNAEEMTGVPISTFSGAESASELWIRHYCREDCAAAAVCEGIECGANRSCHAECGECEPPLSCMAGACVPCERSCEGRACGSDGCDGICGTCEPPLECDASHACSVPDYFPSCSTVTSESHYCATLLEGGIGVVGLDSGTLCFIGKGVEYISSGSAAVNSIALIDGYVYVCAGMMGASGLLKVDVRSGEWDVIPHLYCEAVAAWRGGLLLMSGPGGLGMTHYEDWDHAMAGDGEGLAISPWATRMTVNGDNLYSAWHSTNEVLVNLLPSGEELPSIMLEDYDTWVWGMSVTDDGWLMIANRGTITIFDVATGARLGVVEAHGPGLATMFGGLACVWNP